MKFSPEQLHKGKWKEEEEARKRLEEGVIIREKKLLIKEKRE